MIGWIATTLMVSAGLLLALKLPLSQYAIIRKVAVRLHFEKKEKHA